MRLIQYIRDTRSELTHVNWPTREQTIRFTVAVVGISILVALMLGLSDFVFSRLLTLLF